MNQAAQENPDLSLCADEPIHIPGSIQSHGVLLAVDEGEMRILQASDNTAAVLGIACEELLGQALDSLLGDLQVADLQMALSKQSPENLNPLHWKLSCRPRAVDFDAALHRSDGLLIIELERSETELAINAMEFFRVSYQAISETLKCHTSAELFQRMAALTHKLIGFDRVMIYSFEPDWSGKVLAEACGDHMESYLGLHFPATDIPAQARVLYEKNRLRLLVDVDSSPAMLKRLDQGNDDQTRAQPLDLSKAILRSMSPVHAEYLRNMKVAASMSISLLGENGELRGLIACHHSTPRHVNYQQRTTCDFLARLGSLKLTELEAAATNEYQEILQEKVDHLLHEIAQAQDLPAALIAAGDHLLGVCEASGGAIIEREHSLSCGITPTAAELGELFTYLKTQSDLTIAATDCLSERVADAQSYKAQASGLLAVKISENGERWLAWFRQERPREITWAGSPQYSASLDEDKRIHPRASFEAWRQQVDGHSRPWLPAEINSVLELRTRLLERSLTIAERDKREQLQKQMDELKRLNFDLAVYSEELSAATRAALDASESKSEMVAIVSHDLRAPLTSIHGALSLLASGQLTLEERQELTRTAFSSSTYLLKLIKDLLNLDTIESKAVTATITDTRIQELFDQCRELLKPLADQAKIELRVLPTDKVVALDSDKMLQVLLNLVSNAIKFSSPGSYVEFSASDYQESDGGRSLQISIRDQGRGVPAEFFNTIFRRFGQVTASDRTEKGGNGLGLAICKALVEQQGGRIGLDSVEGQGSTFWVRLPVSH
ncbi:MAG: GAF domain-containing protein [Cyanobacteria bacterium REEB67]|nr:GAF domain-containing protein [Cyanobacteria bacterium REEB67]